MRLTREKSLLLIVDLQAGLLPVIEHGDQAVTEATWMSGMAGELDVPVWVTEQYPEGLGGSEPRLLEAGYEVYWLVEACASRRADEARLAKERMVQAGAVPVSADMVAYEWLHRCDDARFKQAHRHFLKGRSARPLIFSG